MPMIGVFLVSIHALWVVTVGGSYLHYIQISWMYQNIYAYQKRLFTDYSLIFLKKAYNYFIS